MTGADQLAAAIRGPHAPDRDVTGYNGTLVSISANQDPQGAITGISARVTVGADQWIISQLSGPFLNEVATTGAQVLIGRTVRVHMVNGQPEIAYTVDPTTSIAAAAAIITPPVVDPSVGVWNSRTDTGVNINGITGCTTKWAWYINAAYVCELRFKFDASSGNTFPAVGILTIPFPSTIPVPQTSPLIITGRHAAAVMNSTATTVRLDQDRSFYVFANGNPSVASFVEGSMSYQITVP